MRSSTAYALSLVALLSTQGCRKPTATTERADGPAPTQSAVSIGDGEATASSAAIQPPQREEPDANAAHAVLSGSPTRARSIGHTSVVLKLQVSNGSKGAFKPDSKRGPGRYRGEIAAYRLATTIGLSNVPPAYVRTFDLSELLRAAGGEGSETGKLLTQELRPRAGALVDGAIIPWRPTLEFMALEREPRMSEAKAWLRRDGTISESDTKLAPQFATLIAFDWITGNWDRWSGANIGWDPPSHTLLFIDNDGAFYEHPPKAALARSWALVEAGDRVPRGLVTRLRTLDAPALTAAFGADASGAPLLTAAVVEGVAKRIQRYVAWVDKKRASLGDSAVLFFP